MTARILVVDDILANVKLLEARLSAEYFEVVTAVSGAEALEVCAHGQCDVVLLDVMMPGMDGFEVCRRIKANPRTATVPVIMVTALDQTSDRVAGLEAGADDFLTKPVNELALITRVRNLARLKTLTDELTARAATSSQFGLQIGMPTFDVAEGSNGRVLIMDDRPSSYERVSGFLAAKHQVEVETEPHEALFRAAENEYDLAIINLDADAFDGLRLCSQLRSLERTRQLPILVLTNPDNTERLMRGLELGVNDYVMRPIDRNELTARVRGQVRRKRYSDLLRTTVQTTLEMAVTDGLTGLHNRRYLEHHMNSLVEQSLARGKPVSLLIVDIDYFKAINDTYGHDAGDDVLREFARRLRRAVRGIDLACRHGGEEFVVAMPDTDAALAYVVGERIRQKIATDPFLIADGAKEVSVTVSVGVGTLGSPEDTADAILKRADEALYRAKRDGRNRVVAAAA